MRWVFILFSRSLIFFQDIVKDFNDMKSTAEKIQDETRTDLRSKLVALEGALSVLPITITKVLDEAKSTFDTAMAFQTDLQSNGGELIMAGVQTFIDGIIGIAEQFIYHVTNRVSFWAVHLHCTELQVHKLL